eukprot:5076094-Amphidinium_carterae.1
MMYLLMRTGVPTHHWSAFVDTCQLTAYALLNARERCLRARNSAEAKSVWYAILERDVGPPGSSGRFQFREWLLQQESLGWLPPRDADDATSRWR